MKKHGDTHPKHSVRFPEGQNDDCNKIHVLKASNAGADVEIHAGFFKTGHKYEVEFTIGDDLGLGNGATFEIPNNAHFTLKNMQLQNSSVSLTIEYFPVEMDGVVNEIFTIKSSDGSKQIKGIFRAEVLGQGQGTPMLKDGVRCIQRPTSAASSASSH